MGSAVGPNTLERCKLRWWVPDRTSRKPARHLLGESRRQAIMQDITDMADSALKGRGIQIHTCLLLRLGALHRISSSDEQQNCHSFVESFSTVHTGICYTSEHKRRPVIGTSLWHCELPDKSAVDLYWLRLL